MLGVGGSRAPRPITPVAPDTVIPDWNYINISTYVDAASGNITLLMPPNTIPGDLLIACIAYRDAAAFTLPAGWALCATQQSSGNLTENTTGSIASAVMAYIVRGASNPDLTFTRTGGDIARGLVVAYRNNHASPYDAASANTLAAASATITTGTITTAVDKELLVMMVAGARNAPLSAVSAATGATGVSGASDEINEPASNAWTERADIGTTTGADVRLGIFDAVMTTAGATGTISATHGSSARHVMIAAAFKIGLTTIAEAVVPNEEFVSFETDDWVLHNSDRPWTYAKYADNQVGRHTFLTIAGDEWENDEGRDPPHERSELVLHPNYLGNRLFAYDIDIWQAFSQWVEGRNFQYFDTYISYHRTIGQWHANDQIAGFSPIMAAEIDDNGDYFVFSRYDLEGDEGATKETRYTDTSFVMNRWYDHVVHLVFGASGRIEWWRYDYVTGVSTKIIDYTGGLGYPATDSTIYPTHGIYRTKSLDTMAVKIDHIQVGTVDLTARITAPPVIGPPG